MIFSLRKIMQYQLFIKKYARDKKKIGRNCTLDRGYRPKE